MASTENPWGWDEIGVTQSHCSLNLVSSLRGGGRKPSGRKIWRVKEEKQSGTCEFRLPRRRGRNPIKQRQWGVCVQGPISEDKGGGEWEQRKDCKINSKGCEGDL